MIPIGGNAFKNGINLHTDGIKVKCYYDKEGSIKTEVKKENSSDSVINKTTIRYFLIRIPFIRGVVEIINNPIMFLCLFGFILSDFLNYRTNNPQDISDSSYMFLMSGLLISGVVMIISFVVLFTFIANIKTVFKFHGAEHKVINTYRNNKPITLNNISKSQRISPSCGTMYMIFNIFFLIIFLILIPFKSIALLLAISISFELFLIEDPEEKFGIKYFYKVGLFAQKYLTTLEPDEKQLIIAKECMDTLLKNAK